MNLQVQELIQYIYPSSEVWRTWPQTKNLEAFAGSSADAVITNILRKAVLPLYETLTEIKAKLVTTASEFEVCLQQLIETLKQFATDKDMGEAFVRQVLKFYCCKKNSLLLGSKDHEVF